jgi:hypothetical protein
LIESRSAKKLLDQLANPFVIGNGVGTVRDEESLEELAECVIEAMEGLEKQPTWHEKGDVIELVDAKSPHHCQPLLGQVFGIVWQPLGIEVIEVFAALPLGNGVDERISNLELELVGSRGPARGTIASHNWASSTRNKL